MTALGWPAWDDYPDEDAHRPTPGGYASTAAPWRPGSPWTAPTPDDPDNGHPWGDDVAAPPRPRVYARPLHHERDEDTLPVLTMTPADIAATRRDTHARHHENTTPTVRSTR